MENSHAQTLVKKGGGFGEQDIAYPNYHWFGNPILGMT
jgi:hypothetical protein